MADKPNSRFLCTRQALLPGTNEPTTWEETEKRKAKAEKSALRVHKAIVELVKSVEEMTKNNLDLFVSIPMTDSTLFSECPFSQNRVDLALRNAMYKQSEERFRSMAPKTYQSVTELNSFIDEMCEALDWAVKMKPQELHARREALPKIGPETQPEMF